MRSDVQLLTDAIEALEAIEADLDDLDRSTFDLDQTRRQSIYWSMAILGECSGQLVKRDAESVDLFPELRKIVSVRNRLIHGYFAIDDDIVWEIVTVHLGGLALKLSQYVAQLSNADDPGAHS